MPPGGGMMPSPPMGGLPPGGPQQGPGAPQPLPVGDIRGGAMDQYRQALMRRMQGAVPGQAPQQGPMIGAQGAEVGEGGAPAGIGAPPDQMGDEGQDIGSIVKDLMKSRFSRRVIGRGPGQ